MKNWEIEILRKLRNERTTYASMIEYCAQNKLILNNNIEQILNDNGMNFYPVCGSFVTYYDKDGNEIDEAKFLDLMNAGEDVREEAEEIYQQFIISEDAADYLARYTNELVLYSEEADLYLLCVKHWGTSWDYVPANWREVPEEADEE